MFAEAEAGVLIEAAGTADELERWTRARVGGRPLEHIVGYAEFCGQRVLVTEGVFVPRRRTESLVEAALQVMGATDLVVDLCCGCGAIATAIATARPQSQVFACDIDETAVACATRNLEPLGGTVTIGDLYDALPPGIAGRVDIIVVNAPYVPVADIALMPTEARDHEPLQALSGGSDGLSVQRRVVADAGRWLRSRGHLVIESSEEQVGQLTGEMSAAGLACRVRRDPERGSVVAIGISP